VVRSDRSVRGSCLIDRISLVMSRSQISHISMDMFRENNARGKRDPLQTRQKWPAVQPRQRAGMVVDAGLGRDESTGHRPIRRSRTPRQRSRPHIAPSSLSELV